MKTEIPILNQKQVRYYLKIGWKHLQKLISEGKLRIIKVTISRGNGTYRYYESDVLKLMKGGVT